jgi:very-short-patch-repair endonuclease
MKTSKNIYDTLNDKEKLSLLTELYCDKKQSFQDIADQYNTYANKIRRDAKKLNIHIRTKSEAQKNALDTGKHSHPTKGKTRDDATKTKIGNSVMKSWDNLTDAQLEQRKEKAQKNWLLLDEEQRTHMQQLATKAVRETSKVGSKLEKFLQTKLIGSGHKVDFHKEQSLVTTKLQIDLFLPNLNIAIEVDGPSHFAPVWGKDALARNKNYDQKKEGLIFGRGWHLIRIKQTKDFSNARGNKIFEQLIRSIANCTQVKTPQKISIEDQ